MIVCCTIPLYQYSAYFQMALGGSVEFVFPSCAPACVLANADSPATRLFAIKEIVKSETGPSMEGMTQHYIIGYIKTWIESEDSRKAIMSVVTERLGQPWPCNYKALDILTLMPVGELSGVFGKLTELSKKEGEEGKHLKALAEPLIKKVQAEKDKKAAEEAKKREAAVAAAWGGLINPAAIQIQCPPTVSFGYPMGVNYCPNYLRSGLTPHACPLMRCNPGWQPCVHMGFHMG